MSLILSTNTNTGVAEWAEEGAVTGGPQAFTFQPGGVASANIYTTWDALVVDYRAWVIKTNQATYSGLKSAVIGFDATYAAISIPNPTTGNPTLIITPETVLRNSKGTDHGSAQSERVTVTLQAATRWGLGWVDAPSVEPGYYKFEMSGIDLVYAGVTDLFTYEGADPATRGVFNLYNASITASAAGRIHTYGAGVDVEFILEYADLNSNDAASLFRLPVAPAGISIKGVGLSTIQDVFDSAAAVDTPVVKLDGAVQFAQQHGLTLPDFVELFGPSVSDTVRPSPAMTVICRDQLALYGATNIPQVKQAFLFGFTTANPVVNDTLSITDGTTTEVFTFVVAAGAPFEVTIGVTKDLTLVNLAVAITADSTLWEGAFVENPQTGAQACAIIRAVQEKEHYEDRAFGTIDAGADAFVGSFNNVDGSRTLRLSYSQVVFGVLEVADPEINYAGFATVAPVLDGLTVIVLDARSDGYYQALNPLGVASDGSWKLVAAPSTAPAAALTGAGTTLLTRQTRFVLVTLAGVEVRTLQLPSGTAIPGLPLSIRRTDAVGGATLTLDATTGNIDGAATIPVAVSSGVIVVFDGTDWWTVGNTV